MTTSLPIEQLAAIMAAQGDGFELASILDIEGVSEDAWASARRRWLPELATDPDARERYETALTATQERHSRSVRPLDSDVAAWVAFLAAATPFDELAEDHGLTSNDLARLQRGWEARFEAEPELAQQAERLCAESNTSPLPELELGDLNLVPSPYAAARSANDDVVAVAAASAGATAPLSIPRLAAVLVDFSAGIALATSYRDHGFDSAANAHAALDRWQRQLDAEPSLQDALRTQLAATRDADAAVGAPNSAANAHEPASSPSPWAKQAPSLSGSTPLPSSLPAPNPGDPRAKLAVAETAEAIPALAAITAVPFLSGAPMVMQPLLPHELNRPDPAGVDTTAELPVLVDSTAWGIPAVESEPLPFREVEAAAVSIDETGLLDAQLLSIDELPFSDPPASSPPDPSAATAVHPDETSAVIPALRNVDALPWATAASDPTPSAPTPSDGPSSDRASPSVQSNPEKLSPGAQDQQQTRAMPVLQPHVPLPFSTEREGRARVPAKTFVGRLPELSIDQYACYCAERRLYPDHLDEVRGRYHVPSEAAHEILSLRWAARLVAQPEEQRQWQVVHQRYQQWLHSHQSQAQSPRSE